MSINAHPELPPFDYILPKTLADASFFLADHPDDARPLCGGTDIFVRMRDGLWHDKYLVDIKHLDGTASLTFDATTGLTLGAGISMNQVIAHPQVQVYYPLLVQACRSVASYQLRTRATVVGNLCNASPAGDTIGACLVLGGVLSIHGITGNREVSLGSFFLGPGKTVLQPGDIVTTIQFPPPPEGDVGVYIKLGRNTWGDLSIVGVTAYAFPDYSFPSGYRFRVALASVAPVPLLVPSIETCLGQNPITPAALIQAASLAEAACTPIDDVRSSARYRRAMVLKLTTRALEQVWHQLESKEEVF